MKQHPTNNARSIPTPGTTSIEPPPHAPPPPDRFREERTSKAKDIPDFPNPVTFITQLREALEEIREKTSQVKQLLSRTITDNTIEKQVSEVHQLEQNLQRHAVHLYQSLSIVKQSCLEPIREEYAHRIGAVDDPKMNRFIGAAIGSGAMIASVIGFFYFGLSTLTEWSHSLAHGMSAMTFGVGTAMWGAVAHVTVFFGAFIISSAISAASTYGWGAARAALAMRRGKSTQLDQQRQQVAAHRQKILEATKEVNEQIQTLRDALDEIQTKHLEIRDASSHYSLRARACKRALSGQFVTQSQEIGKLLGTISSTCTAIEHENLAVASSNLSIAADEQSWYLRWQKAGRDPAIDGCARDAKNLSTWKPGKFRRVLSVYKGTRLSLSKFFKFNIETGHRVDRALLDALDGFFSTINLGKEKDDGHSLAHFMGLVFESKEKDMWVRVGKVAPNIPLFVFKKAYYMILLKREGSVSGERTSDAAMQGLLNKQHILSETGIKLRAIGNHVVQGTIGVTRKLFERGLVAYNVSRAINGNRYSFSRIKKFFEAKKNIVVNQCRKAEVSFTIPEEYRSKSSFQLHQIFIQRCNQLEVTRTEYKQLSGLLRYALLKERLELIEARERHALKQASLGARGGRILLALAKACTIEDSSKREHRLLALAPSLKPKLSMVIGELTVQAVTPAGEFLVADDSNELYLVPSDELVERISSGCKIDVVPGADEAHIRLVESYLAITLSPSEQRALIEAKESYGEGERQAVLSQNGFTVLQLYGIPSRQGARAIPGLLQCGLA